jgi:hypothetical protein
MNTPISKSSHGSFKMVVYYDIIGQKENYVIVNEFKKFIRKETILDNFLTYMLREFFF